MTNSIAASSCAPASSSTPTSASLSRPPTASARRVAEGGQRHAGQPRRPARSPSPRSISMAACANDAAADAMRLSHIAECRRARRSVPATVEPVAAAEVVCGVDGRTLHLHVSACPTLTPAARLDGVVMMAADVGGAWLSKRTSDRTPAPQSLGSSPAASLHDFDNLLTGVLGNAQSLLQDRFQPRLPSKPGRRRPAAWPASPWPGSPRRCSPTPARRFFIEPLDLLRRSTADHDLVHASVPKCARLKLTLAEGLPTIRATPVGSGGW